MTNFYIKCHVFKSIFIHHYAKKVFPNFIKRALFRSGFTGNLKIFDKKALSLAAAGTGLLFSWDEHRITDEEIRKEVNDMVKIFEPIENNDTDNDKINNNNKKLKIDFEATRNFQDKEWTKIYDKKDLLIWRRKIDFDSVNNLDIFEHKILGRIDHITPIEYYQVQVDLEYRKEWDFLIKLLEMTKKDSQTNTELVRWVSKFPYPLSDREYVYVRRYCIEPNEKILVLVSRALSFLPDDISTDKKNVLVSQYKSNMIIIPYTDIDKPGIYYVIQYYDANKARIPKLAYKWMATSGLPDYVDKLIKATLKLREKMEVDGEKNFLESFDLFSMNDEVDVSKLQILVKPDEVAEVEAVDNLDDDKKLEVQVKNSDGLEEVVPVFLRSVIDKMNRDYFDEYEPHPIFHHY